MTVLLVGGGLLRDVLLGITPPGALDASRYLFVAAVAGLGLFVATGTATALDAGLGAVPAIVLGCLTGIGGGIARDVLVGVVPVVLRRELYAVPAVLGASVVVLGDRLDTPASPTAAVAAVVVFAVRMLGVWRDWHFPVRSGQP